jgi:hypothetical protein
MLTDEERCRLEEVSRTMNERPFTQESTYRDEDLACGAAIPSR